MNATATATASKNALELRNLSFFYGKFQGLRNVSLDIAEHKVTAFIGPSGCGKSTLLRTLNRMYSLYPGQRAEGSISFYGQDILDPKQDINLLRARIGMVFQKPTPFPMSIYDNIAFGVRLYENLSARAMDERVEWALTKAALWEEAKDKLKQSGMALSGGQQQRLCIARAVAVQPEVLLLDEPTSALDASVQAEILNLLDDLRRKMGLTYILVSHDLAVVAHLCERLLVMRHGEAVEETTAEALRSGKASNEYTQSLIQASQGFTRKPSQAVAIAG